jgi:hypothetical protein
VYFFTLPSAASVRAYWAAEVPVIPDSVSRRAERRGLDAAAARSAALAAQRAWLARLHADDAAGAVSLRFVNEAAGGGWRLRLGFVGRSEAAGREQAVRRAREDWEVFRATFPEADYPLAPAVTLDEFARLFAPFYPGAVAEVRRYDEVATLVEAYLPHPFSASSPSDMQPLCQALLASESPHIVAVNLRPTALSEDERALLAGEIKRLSDLKQRAVQTGVQAVSYSVTVQKQQAEAELAEAAYRELAASLRRCFEMVVLVGAPERVAGGVLRALVAEAAHPDGAESCLTPRAFAAHPERAGERVAAFKNLFEVGTDTWGTSLAPAGLERLPRLFPVAEAHALFRLPVADEEGVYGLPASAFGQALGAGRRRMLRAAQAGAGADEIALGGVTLTRDSLTRHVFVAGVPGMGKTNTCLYLLERLWNADAARRVPFLVLEPAKFEYRGLIGAPGVRADLLVFTAGDERVAPLRFNPFEVPAGVSLEAHVGRLLDIFRASMAMWGPLPAILEKLVRRLYRLKGWRYVGANDDCEPPTMGELYADIGSGVRALGYSRETESEATAALEVRVGRLCAGSLGKMLDTARSVDFDELMRRPVVVEIASVGNTDDRAFLMALLLNRLYQYWIVRKDEAGRGLRHLTLVEEAHNLLANVPTGQAEGQANPKGEAVQQFANMLAEIRGFGEGLLIVDQSPSKLIPDVVRMTGTKIAHGIVAEEDRQALRTSMNLTAEQAYQLALLPPGEAAVFQSGAVACAQVRVPHFKDRAAGFALNVGDDEVREFAAPFRAARQALYLPTPGCVNCPAQCQHDETVEVAFARLGDAEAARLERELRAWWLRANAGVSAAAPYAAFERALRRAANVRAEPAVSRERAFCAMTKLSHRHLREDAAAQFIAPGEVGRLHRALTAALISSEPEAAAETLREVVAAVARPDEGERPFPGCEHCALPCLLRGEALRAMRAAAEIVAKLEAGRGDNADLVAGRAWEVTRAAGLTARVDGLQHHLAYCIGIQLCEAVESRADRWRLREAINAGDLKFAGCVHCPSRCRHGAEMEALTRHALERDGAALAAVWQARFGKSRAAVVGELAQVFRAYAARSPRFTEAGEREQRVMTFCAALHARATAEVLGDAGAKAAQPQAWWGRVMAEGCGVSPHRL